MVAPPSVMSFMTTLRSSIEVLQNSPVASQRVVDARNPPLAVSDEVALPSCTEPAGEPDATSTVRALVVLVVVHAGELVMVLTTFTNGNSSGDMLPAIGLSGNKNMFWQKSSAFVTFGLKQPFRTGVVGETLTVCEGIDPQKTSVPSGVRMALLHWRPPIVHVTASVLPFEATDDVPH
jgi:hypothetical protein